MCHTVGGRQGGVGSAGLGRLPRCGFGRVSGGACVGGVGTVGTWRTAIGEGLWTGTWMLEVDRGRGEVSGSRGLGGGEGGGSGEGGGVGVEIGERESYVEVILNYKSH